jgi:hypothetical protein
MTTPTFTPAPAIVPTRGSPTYSVDASAWVTWQNAFEGDLSTAMPWVALQVTAVADDAEQTALDRLQTIADAALTAQDAIDSAAAAASALGNANSATTSATLASTTAAALTGFDLDAIAETKAITAVAGVVYKTALDSDGGAWINGAASRATEWYNQTLNTATRGGTRAFPAVAVPIPESSTVTVYDGDDPALPMWHVEDYTGLTITSVAMVNGKLIIGTTTGVIVSDYASGKLGTTTPDYTTSTTPAIISNSVLDVAITVLADAPIDAATGLQVPTKAVATDGNGTYLASVIQNDGTVYDIGADGGNTATSITISSTYELIIVRSDGTVYVWNDIGTIAADGTAPDTTYAAADNFGTPTIAEAA